MIIKDLSHLEDVVDSELILGGASGLVTSEAFVLGSSGYTFAQTMLIKKGFVIIGYSHSVAVGTSFSQSSSSSVVSGVS